MEKSCDNNDNKDKEKIFNDKDEVLSQLTYFSPVLRFIKKLVNT